MSGAQAETATDEEEKPKRGGKMILVVSLVLALVGGGGGYVAATSGILPIGSGAQKGGEDTPAGQTAARIAFLPVDPIVVSLGATGMNRHLSFRAQLEVPQANSAEVTALMPRIVDVMNSYLRAVDVREFDAPHGLIRLRAQMLRRVQLIVGDGKVNDLLVMEFVLN
jgi:flagellar protein FliL